MTVQLECDADKNLTSATVVFQGRTYTIPLRKSVDGWEAQVPIEFPQGDKLTVELKIAFAITGKLSAQI